MPSLKDIRKRISTVKNTQKITRAMKLVAAAKLRRAQDAIIAARPYAGSLAQVVAELSSETDAHPLFVDRVHGPGRDASKDGGGDGDGGRRAAIVMLTSDRGLAGAFNASIIKRVEAYVDAELSDYTDVSLRIIGRKGNDYFKRRSANIAGYDPAPTSANALSMSRDIANRVIDDFTAEKVDRVYLVYNEFRSAISQGVVVRQLLPVVADEVAVDRADDEDGAPVGDTVYEPSKDELLSHLVPLYVQIEIYRASLESIASELGARMTAMDNATRNAGEMIDKMTLQYNRARQAAITKELMEIIGGAEALKG